MIFAILFYAFVAATAHLRLLTDIEERPDDAAWAARNGERFGPRTFAAILFACALFWPIPLVVGIVLSLGGDRA